MKSIRDVEARYRMILNVHEVCKYSASLTAKTLHISSNTVRNAVRWEIAGYPHKNPQGRPEKLTVAMKQFIVANTMAHPEMSGDDISIMVFRTFRTNVCCTTINKFRDSVGFKYGPYINKIPLNLSQKQKRVCFARNLLLNRVPHRQLIFCDEKWFCIGGRNKVWRVSGEIYPEITKPKVAHEEKVMIWGAVGYGFKSSLVFFQKNVDSEVYVNEVIFGSSFIWDADVQYGIDGWAFVQDNARPHVSDYTLQYLDALKVIIIDDWPPYSPDLNPIEIIWAIMAQRVNKLKPKTAKELKTIVSLVWANLSIHTINGLVDRFPDKLLQVVNTNGDQAH